MRKIYSLVLMAMMLLVGTNVKANVATFAELQQAIADAGTTTTNIVLGADITATDPISVTEAKKIELDLNGHNINSTTTGNMLIVNNGSLVLKGTGVISGVGCYSIARMTGSNEDVPNYSVLTVGEGVTITADGGYGINMFQATAPNGYGMVLNVAGTVISQNGHGVWVLGNIKQTAGTNHSQVNVLPSGKILADNTVDYVISANTSGKPKAVYNAGYAEGFQYGQSSCGIYGGGFANYNIQGEVSGGNGIYMKGGNLLVNGGHVTGTAEEYWKPLFYGDGFIAAGSAIVLDNNAGYCPVISMKVTGDAVVTSETGDAIEELITSGSEKMGAQNFVIESGTFVSGTDQNNQSHYAVTVTDQLGTQVKQEGTVSGGMFSTPVDNVLANTGGATTTVVIDNVEYQVIIPTNTNNYYERTFSTDITYGTICLPKDGIIYGATLYVPEYKTDNMLYFVEAGGELVGGKAYVFKRTGSKIIVNYAANATDKALVTDEAMVGSYAEAAIANNTNYCIIKNDAYYHVNTDNVKVGENRAYIDLSQVPTTSTTPAPSPRRIVFHDASTETTTGIDNVEAVEGVQKVMIDGQMYILRGEHMFNAAGQMVK